MNITTQDEARRCLDLAARERILSNALKTEQDAEIQAIKARFASKIDAAEKAEAAQLSAVKVWAELNRTALLPRDSKSAALGSHKLGWQDNGGAIKAAKGSSEKKVLAKLLKSPAMARLFVRHTPALDKEAITAKWARWGAKLRTLGLRLVKEEVFFITLDITQPADARVKPEEVTQ